MVSEVSAIDVASTTLRRPGGAGAMARSCASDSSAPNSGTMSTAGSAMRSRSSVSVRRISAAPGRNTKAEPVSARNARATVSATSTSMRVRGSRPT
jgi:hypothetical protein